LPAHASITHSRRFHLFSRWWKSPPEKVQPAPIHREWQGKRARCTRVDRSLPMAQPCLMSLTTILCLGTFSLHPNLTPVVSPPKPRHRPPTNFPKQPTNQHNLPTNNHDLPTNPNNRLPTNFPKPAKNQHEPPPTNFPKQPTNQRNLPTNQDNLPTTYQ
jgi:hypothetical protein